LLSGRPGFVFSGEIVLRIPVLYSQPQPAISFEFFPPKTDEAEETLLRETVPALKRLGPSFISVTYGAGGSTHDRSLRIVHRLIRDHQIEAVAHLTCVGGTREILSATLDEAHALGIENILALRGDPPKGQTEFKPLPGGFSYAGELVRFVKSRGHFTIGVAGYPEGHVECGDKILDWDRTAAKIAEGAEYLLTQLFYDADDFLAFEDYLRTRHGVKIPIVPGILPFLGAEQIKRFTRLCGAKLPETISKRLEVLGHDDESVRKLGVEVCTDLCRRLLDHGVPGLHIYCLNRAASAAELLQNLGLAPKS
jgi:methylenetetrahydrofolate reductase (NADPH)